MNALSALIKCVSLGLLVGFPSISGVDIRTDLLPLTEMIAFIVAVLLLLVITNPKLAGSKQLPAVRPTMVPFAESET